MASGSSRIARSCLQVRRAEQVRDVVHGRGGELGQYLGLDLEELSSERPLHADAVGREQPVLGVIGARWQHVGVGELGHGRHILVAGC